MRERRYVLRVLVLFSLVAGVVAGVAGPAQATFHLIKIRQVFAGVPSAPDAQYVELQAYAPCCQNLLNGHSLDVFNASGKKVGSFTFSDPVADGASQATDLIATAEAESFFGVTADLEMTPVIPPAGGKVCWADQVDCVSWGDYDGSSKGTGTPFDRSESIVSGAAMDRIISRGTDPQALDAQDDTDKSAKDFHYAPPAPTNNAGDAGTAPGGTLSFSAGQYKVREAAGHATITVNRDGGTGSTTVDYSTRNGTATARSDYTPASGTLTFVLAGAAMTFRIRIKSDSHTEGSETVRLRLRNPTGKSVLGIPNAVLTIKG